jgi:hypothetical protein
MKFRVTKLRERGKRLADIQIANAQHLLGDLVSSHVASTKGFYRVADLKEDSSGGLKESLATLFEPELVQISASGMLLRGIEKMEGRAYLQEWKCDQF